jgi:hypothetical protein
MDDFDGLFDQFGQPRKRCDERREIVARLLGTASEPAPAPPADPPPPAAVLRIRNEIAAEFDANNFVHVPGAPRRLSFTLAQQMGIAIEYVPLPAYVESGDPDGDEDSIG